MDLKAGKLKSTWSDQTWNYLCFSYWMLHMSLNSMIFVINGWFLSNWELSLMLLLTRVSLWLFGFLVGASDSEATPWFWTQLLKKTLPHCGSMILKRDILNFCLILLWFRSKVRKQHRSAAAGLYECCLQVWGEVATFSPQCFYNNPSLGVGTRKGSRQLLAAGPNWQSISTQFICILDLYLLKYKYKK